MRTPRITIVCAEGPVSRCVCMDLDFARLRARAASECLGFAELKAVTGCCGGCGTCEPYVRLMLATGQTRFAVLQPGQIAQVLEWCDRDGSGSRAHPQGGSLG